MPDTGITSVFAGSLESPDIAVSARAARQIAETGDISEFDTPGNAPAIARQEAFDQRECGLEPPGS